MKVVKQVIAYVVIRPSFLIKVDFYSEERIPRLQDWDFFLVNEQFKPISRVESLTFGKSRDSYILNKWKRKKKDEYAVRKREDRVISLLG